MADCIDQPPALAGADGEPAAESAPGGIFQQLFNANPAPIWAFEAQSLRFLAVNDAAVIRYGYPREELLRLTVRDVLPPEQADWLAEGVAADALNPGESVAWAHRTKAGIVAPLEAVVTPFDCGGRAAWLVVGAAAPPPPRGAARVRARTPRVRKPARTRAAARPSHMRRIIG